MFTIKMTIVALALFGVFVTSAVQAARAPQAERPVPTVQIRHDGTQVAYSCYTTRLGDTWYTNCM